MKRLVIALLAAVLVFSMSALALAGPRDDQLKQVDEAMKKGLPQTAIEHLEPIIQGAMKDKAYAEAIKANYDQGPPGNWRERYISAYASSHPWEDWAETWAHYLHIIDSLDTAMAHGLDAEDLEMDIEPFTRADLYDPDDPNADRALLFLNAWIELVTVLNEIARSLGHPDFYPFVMPREVVKKLHFISLVIRDAQGPASNPKVSG